MYFQAFYETYATIKKGGNHLIRTMMIYCCINDTCARLTSDRFNNWESNHNQRYGCSFNRNYHHHHQHRYYYYHYFYYQQQSSTIVALVVEILAKLFDNLKVKYKSIYLRGGGQTIYFNYGLELQLVYLHLMQIPIIFKSLQKAIAI